MLCWCADLLFCFRWPCLISTWIILWMRPAHEWRRNYVTSSLIGGAHTQNDPCITIVIRWYVREYNDIIKWKHFPCYWPFVRGINWSPMNSPHKCQCRGALMLSLICACTNDWVNNRAARWVETQSRPLWCHCNYHTRYTILLVPMTQPSTQWSREICM